MVASSLAPTYADSIADTFESTTGTALGPLQTPSMRSTAGVSLTGDSGAYVQSVTRDGMGGATVEFVVDGQTHQVDFTGDQIANIAEITEGDRTFEFVGFHLSNANPLDKVYFRVARWATWTNDDASDGFASFGVRTRVENLPMGSATYEGYMYGETWNNDGNWPRYNTHARRTYGLMTLNADFDDSEISGEVNGLQLPGYQRRRQDVEYIAGNHVNCDFRRSDSRKPIYRRLDGPGYRCEQSRFNERSVGSKATCSENSTDRMQRKSGGVMNGHRDATDTTPSQTFIGVFGGREAAINTQIDPVFRNPHGCLCIGRLELS